MQLNGFPTKAGGEDGVGGSAAGGRGGGVVGDSN